MSNRLGDFITPVPRYARASNLELDADNPVVAEYHLIDAGRAVLNRLLHGRVSAMVVTGPYGSGKSTFALYLDALLGPADSAVSAAARAKLMAIEPALAASLADFVATAERQGGPVRAIATGRPEPLPATVGRALRYGVERHSALPAALRDRVDRLTGRPMVAARVAELAREISVHAPLCLIIDELGLVFDASLSVSEDDLWLLQELAETAARPGPLGPGFVLALQHRSLAEQVAGGGSVPRSWRKVQGRFEEVAFVESREAVFSLIPRVLQRQAPGPLEAAIAERAESLWSRATSLGLGPYLPGGAAAISAAYPLDPGVLLVLPDLTSYYGQRERTLLAFLAGGEPGSVRTFLEAHAADERPLPMIGLPEVYEFFVATGSHRLGPAARVSRWAEVERRIREVGALDDLDGDVARSVALLNLVGRGGAARASEAIIEMCVPGARPALQALVRRGLITYRSTGDEFRIWEGSDVDLEAGIARYATLAASRPLADLLNTVAPMPPAIATAHSERTGVMRSFERRFVSGIVLQKPAQDGLIAYRVDDESSTPAADDLPVIVLAASDLAEVRRRAIETAALSELTVDEEVIRDWVALREVRDRYALGLDALRGALDAAFDPSAARATLLLDGASRELEHAAISRLASIAADLAFGATPPVANEMFSVHELTSQGARARSLLFAAMIDHPGETTLGLTGWGPERALYEAALHDTGLHDPMTGSFGPRPNSAYVAIWDTMAGEMRSAVGRPIEVETILATAEQRPFGLRRSLTPVLWLAILLAEASDLAVFERGSFVARLSADVMERVVKAPTTFSIRHFAVRGPRKAYLRELSDRVFASQGDPTVVSVVRGLVSFVRGLPPATRGANSGLSETARAVRDAIVTTREPDVLLFDRLPSAVDARPVGPTGIYDANLPERIATALVELSGWYHGLVGRTRAALAEAFDLTDSPSLRPDLRLQSAPIAKYVIEPGLRGFLAALADTARELDDDWLGTVVVASGLSPLGEWSDEDLDLFRVRARALARAQRRVLMLYGELWAGHRSEGFIAKRVTVTEPDGRETSQMVWYDGGAAAPIERILDTALADAEGKVGQQAGRILLAMLAERLQGVEERGKDDSEQLEGRRAG